MGDILGDFGSILQGMEGKGSQRKSIDFGDYTKDDTPIENPSALDYIEGGARALDRGLLRTPVGLMDFGATLGSSLAGTDITRDPLYRAARSYEGAVDEAFQSNKVMSPMAESVLEGTGAVGGQALTATLTGGSSLGAQIMKPVAGATIVGMGTSQGVNDATQHGASPEDIKTSAAWNSLVGLSEFAPLEKILGIANKAAPGIKGKIVDIFATGGLEGLQEWFQQGGTNLTAKLTYDEERDLSDGLEQSAQAGGAVGMIAAAIATMFGVHIKQPKMSTDPGETVYDAEKMPDLPGPARRTVEKVVDAQWTEIDPALLGENPPLDSTEVPNADPNLPSTLVRSTPIYDGAILDKIAEKYPEGSPRQKYAIAYAEKKLRGQGNVNTAETPDVIPLEEPPVPVNVSTEDAEVEALTELLDKKGISNEDKELLQQRLDEITKPLVADDQVGEEALVPNDSVDATPVGTEDSLAQEGVGAEDVVPNLQVLQGGGETTYNPYNTVESVIMASVNGENNETLSRAAEEMLDRMDSSEALKAVGEALKSGQLKNIPNGLEAADGKQFIIPDIDPQGFLCRKALREAAAYIAKPQAPTNQADPTIIRLMANPIQDPEQAALAEIEGKDSLPLNFKQSQSPTTIKVSQPFTKAGDAWIAPTEDGQSAAIVKEGKTYTAYYGTTEEIQSGTAEPIGEYASLPKARQAFKDEVAFTPQEKISSEEFEGRLDALRAIGEKQRQAKIDELMEIDLDADTAMEMVSFEDIVDEENAADMYGDSWADNDRTIGDIAGDMWTVLGGNQDVDTLRSGIGSINSPETRAAKKRLNNDIKALVKWAKKAGEQLFHYPATFIRDGEPVRLYHGTVKVYTDPSVETLGDNTQVGSARLAFFLGEHPDTANAYTDPTTKENFSIAMDIAEKNPTYIKYRNEYDVIYRQTSDLIRNFQAFAKFDWNDIDGSEVATFVEPFIGLEDMTAALVHIGDEKLGRLQTKWDQWIQNPQNAAYLKRVQNRAEEFKPLREQGLAVFYNAKLEASHDIGEPKYPNVRPSHVIMNNPITFEMKGVGYNERRFTDKITQAWADGHDAVIFKNTRDGGPVDNIYAIRNAEQIIPAFEHEAAVIESLWKMLGKMLNNQKGSVDLSGARGLASELIGRMKRLYEGLKNFASQVYSWGTVRKKSQSVDSLSPKKKEQYMVGMRFFMQKHAAALKTDMDGAIKELYDEMVKTDRIVPVYKSGQENTKMPIRQLSWIPQQLAPAYRPGVEDKKISQIARQMRSPSNVFRNFFPTWANPSVDMSEAGMAYLMNLSNSQKWVKDVLKNVPDDSKGMKKVLDEIYESVQPLIDARDKQIVKAGRIVEKLKMTKDPDERKALIAQLKATQKRVKIKTKKISDEVGEKYDSALPALAEAYADVRISLQILEELPEGIKISPEEITTADKLREYFKSTGKALQEVGIPIKLEGKYIHRLLPSIFNDAEGRNFAKDAKLPLVMKFLHQEEDGRQWYPSIHMIMDSYVPMVERKLAYQPFLNRWTKAIDAMPKELNEYMTQWLNSTLFKQPLTTVEKALNNVVGFEYLRLIGMSLSVGVKHVPKMVDSLALYDMIINAKAGKQILKMVAQKIAGTMNIKLDDNMNVELLRAFVNQAILVKYMDETPNMTSAGKKFRQFGGLPVNIVEMMDNGVTMFSTLLTTQSSKMNPQEASRVIWETMLVANFRGGHDQPLMYKKASTRALAMFQQTPHKLWEYRASIISKAAHGEVDQFGTPYAVVLARYIMIFGLAEWLVRELFDSSIVDQALHTPYASHWIDPVKGGYELHIPKLSSSPLIDWMYQAKRTNMVKATEQHFSYMGQMSKLYMSYKGKYPKQWYNNPWLFQAGIKKVHKSSRSTSRRGSRNRSSSTRRR